MLSSTIFVAVFLIHFYWVQFGVRQDHTISYPETKESPFYIVHAFGGLHALRGSVVSNLRTLTKFSLSVCIHFNLRCFLDAGTLLGAHREGRIFDWEEDADLGFMEEDFESFRNLEKTGKFRQFSVKLFPQHNFDIIFRPDEDHIIFRAVDRSSHLYVDFNMFKKNGSKLESPYSWSYDHCAHCLRRKNQRPKKVSLPLSDVFPLKPCSLEGMKTLCPQNITAYLEYQFGSDFQTRPIEFRVSTKVFLYVIFILLSARSIKVTKRLVLHGMPKNQSNVRESSAEGKSQA